MTLKDLVKKLQWEMNAQGESLSVDGDAGLKTQTALLKFDVSLSLKRLEPQDPAPTPFKRGSVAWYESLYKGLTFDKGYEGQILSAAKSLLRGKPRYLALEQELGVPWATIAAIHKMEGDGNFDTYLGNGQSIHRVTTIVPKGRGPFASFEDGARDALRLDGLTAIRDWSIGLELKLAEQFNGMGYFNYHSSEFSPYIWACSSVNDGTGKYTSDGHYDPNANANAQVGVATMFKQLELLGEYSPKFSS